MDDISATRLEKIEKIPPKRLDALHRLNLNTLGDLLHYRPVRYEDRREVHKIDTLEKGDAVIVLGEIKSVRFKEFRRARKVAVEVVISDSTGILRSVWWGQRWPLKVFSEGMMVLFFGKISRYNPVTMDVSQYEIVYSKEDTKFYIGCIVPVYSLSEGITQFHLRGLVHRCLQRFTDLIPDGRTYPEELKFPSRKNAIRWLHFPTQPGEEELARRRLAMDEFVDLQMEFMRRRRNLILSCQKQGIVCPGNNQFIRPFLKSLPFSLTDSQNSVLKEIRADLMSGLPMRRLLQGDVGSGKTVVSACVALMVIEAGFNVVLMAPTEILAIQHHKNFSKWFEPLGISVRLWTGRTKEHEPDEKQPALFSKGKKPEVVIGTHALIEDSFTIEKLGLVIIDEQHKFGVEQREKLLKKGFWPHLLIMTATPIPRTLGLTLYGDLEVSCIKQLPEGRGSIRTFIRKGDKRLAVWDFIRTKLAEGRQAYVVYPLIEESENKDIKAVEAGYVEISRYMAPYTVGLLHGRMKGDEKEWIMKQFAANFVQVLVSTTVVEVGVDVPNSTIMLIENAERFGLAGLHQLRGRIGRGKENSFCILMMGTDDEEAESRLRILVEYRDGFRIAEEDLKLRGPGDFLGDRQHGMPTFLFGDLYMDYALMEQAREYAKTHFNG